LQAAAGPPGGEDGAVIGEGELWEGVRRKGGYFGAFIAGLELAADGVAGVSDEDDALARLRVDA
jgi:hypothetical protein